MADSVALLALALVAGAPLALAPLPTSAAAVAVAWILRTRVRGRMLALAGAALLAGALRAQAALDGAVAVHARTVAVLTPPARCDGEGTILSSPVVIGRASPKAGAEGSARVDIELAAGHCGEVPFDVPLRARVYGAPEGLARGDRVAVVADLAPLQLFQNEELPDPRPPLARSGVAASGGAVEVHVLQRSRSAAALIDRARAHVRGRIEATFHPDAAALGRALVLGETDLDAADDEAFRLSGLSHLLAVSGTHLVIAVAGFAAALRAILVRVERVAARMDPGRIAAACAVPAAWLYADFAGGSGSAVRAAAMLSAVMLARAVGRHAPAVRTFSCSLLLLAACDPLLACDTSFGLSAGATAGLMFLQKPIAAVVVRGPAPLPTLLAPVATTLAATVACAPILALLAPTMPALGVLSNLVAAPVGELAALPVCLAHAALGWAPPLERGAALLGSGALLGVRAVARWSTAAGAVIPVPPPSAWQLATIAVAVVAAWTSSGRRRLASIAVGAAVWAACELSIMRAGAPRGALRISVLDVGQGDSLLVDFPDGSAMLIDGGGVVGSPIDFGERVVQPVLRARRRRQLAVMVLTHPHPDHVGGLASTLPRVEVGELWDTGQGEEQDAGPVYASLIASARTRKVPIKRPHELCGAPRFAAGVTIEVLAPCPGYSPDAGANDNSLVLRLTYGKRTALLVGDAERDQEHQLLASAGARLAADLLKIGHHGSRTSSSAEFLAAVKPPVAVISAGVRNRYGHPHPRTLARLSAQGIDVLRTDRGGAVIWETDGERVVVRRP